MATVGILVGCGFVTRLVFILDACVTCYALSHYMTSGWY